MDLVVARVEEDVLELNAPPTDSALGVGDNPVEADGGDGGNDLASNASGSTGGTDTASEIDVSEVESILSDEGSEGSGGGSDSTMSHISTDPSTDEDGVKDDDNDSIISKHPSLNSVAKSVESGLSIDPDGRSKSYRISQI